MNKNLTSFQIILFLIFLSFGKTEAQSQKAQKVPAWEESECALLVGVAINQLATFFSDHFDDPKKISKNDLFLFEKLVFSRQFFCTNQEQNYQYDQNSNFVQYDKVNQKLFIHFENRLDLEISQNNDLSDELNNENDDVQEGGEIEIEIEKVFLIKSNNKITNQINELILDKKAVDSDFLYLSIKKSLNIINISHGLDPFSYSKFDTGHDQLIDILQGEDKKEYSMDIQVYQKNLLRKNGHQNYENTKWQFVPVKLVAVPLQKIMYEIPNALLSVPGEALTYSPWQNLIGTYREFKMMVKSAVKNVKEIIEGVAHPKRAGFVEGVVGLTFDPAMHAFKGSLGIAKAGMSLIAYPVYRLLGGRKKTLLRNYNGKKRVAIIKVDSDFSKIIDVFGEEITKAQLSGHADYVCMSSEANYTKLRDCIISLPTDAYYMDLYALTHTGGMNALHDLAQLGMEVKGLIPATMISIGCNDPAAKFVHYDQSNGQNDISWGVHFYLSSLLSKHTRGMTVEDSARDAFIENIPLNLINPISLLALVYLQTQNKYILGGYIGSKPISYSINGDTISDYFNDTWRFINSKKAIKYYETNKAKIEDVKVIEYKKVISDLRNFHQYVADNKNLLNHKDQKIYEESIEKLKTFYIKYPELNN